MPKIIQYSSGEAAIKSEDTTISIEKPRPDGPLFMYIFAVSDDVLMLEPDQIEQLISILQKHLICKTSSSTTTLSR